MNNLISILFVGVNLLLAFLCLINIQQVNKSGNRWFGIFILCIFFLNTEEILGIARLKIENDIVSAVLSLPCFMFAPAFYFTILYFITPNRSWKIKDYFHLFTLAILYILFFIYIVLYQNSFFKEQSANFIFKLLQGNFLDLLLCVQVVYYCTLSWIKLKKHEKNILLFSSNIEKVDLRWLKYIMVCFIIMAFFFISNLLYNIPDHYFIIINAFYLVGFFIIAYFSMKQEEIYPFTKDQKDEIIDIVITDILEKQPKKLIEDGKLEELKNTLLEIMETRKPFLDCELSLVKLASMLDISSHQLSHLINTGFDENFYQFINRYRIEEAKKLILDEKMSHLSFQGIAFEVGFNSKSVFNTTFKKCTGLTPSDYKSSNQQEIVVKMSSD